MALNIRDPKAHLLAQEVARRTGETLTRAVVTALEERLQRLNPARRQLSEEEKQARLEKIEELVEEFNKLPVVDDRPMEEILYDEHGLPR